MFFSFTASICNQAKESLNRKLAKNTIFHVDTSTSQLVIRPKLVSIKAKECLANKDDCF